MSELQLQQATVLDRTTGEVIAIADASTEDLARFMANQQDLRGELSDAEAAVSAELVSRLDAGATWTLRVGDPKDVQYEITAPSPTAGTEQYPAALLEPKLAGLIAKGTITTGAASKACKRQLTVTFDVPWTGDPRELAGSVQVPGTQITIGGVEVSVAKAEASVKPVAAGIGALRKVPGTAEALDAVKHISPQGQRRAKVTVKR